MTVMIYTSNYTGVHNEKFFLLWAPDIHMYIMNCYLQAPEKKYSLSLTPTPWFSYKHFILLWLQIALKITIAENTENVIDNFHCIDRSKRSQLMENVKCKSTVIGAYSAGSVHVRGKQLYSLGNSFNILFIFLANMSLRQISFIPGKWLTFWKHKINNWWRLVDEEEWISGWMDQWMKMNGLVDEWTSGWRWMD